MQENYEIFKYLYTDCWFTINYYFCYSENDHLTGHFRVFFRPPDPKSEKNLVNQLIKVSSAYLQQSVDISLEAPKSYHNHF